MNPGSPDAHDTADMPMDAHMRSPDASTAQTKEDIGGVQHDSHDRMANLLGPQQP